MREDMGTGPSRSLAIMLAVAGAFFIIAMVLT